LLLLLLLERINDVIITKNINFIVLFFTVMCTEYARSYTRPCKKCTLNNLRRVIMLALFRALLVFGLL